MGKKVGKLIREARNSADLTQEQLAKRISGLSANDVSLAERGEKDLTQEQLKKIAKITGVTQASLVNAAKAEKTGSAKTTTKSSSKSSSKSAAKTTTTAAKKAKTPSNANTSMKVTSTEKKLIEYYRLADSDTKKAATKVLKGECPDMVGKLLNGDVSDLLEGVLGSLFGN